MSQEKIRIFWFRRDLRLQDNHGLYQALKDGIPVLPLFIFDRDILDQLEDRQDRRVEFIHQCLQEIKGELAALASDLLVRYGKPLELFKELSQQLPIESVYCNHDYEPYALERDKQIKDLLEEKSILFHSFKDQCIFEKKEVLSKQGKSYTIFTPYSKMWKSQVDAHTFQVYPSSEFFHHFIPKDHPALEQVELSLISLEQMDFKARGQHFPSKKLREDIVEKYDQTRDYPAIEGTTRLSVHLRFGTLSIRALARKAQELNQTWLNELIWRDFYMMILHEFPHVAKRSFRPEYDTIPWRNQEKEFEAWCAGKTGYPLVDAGMRELNESGYMHNRVRMLVASFLTKHLLIDWRWGEAYFAQKLLDFDLSANNGGWQWAAGSGCDAAPYFRIFNPSTQIDKFDKKMIYIKKWVPEVLSGNYPRPIVEHKAARERALTTYKEALNRAKS